jgi:hypothetical protein
MGLQGSEAGACGKGRRKPQSFPLEIRLS